MTKQRPILAIQIAIGTFAFFLSFEIIRPPYSAYVLVAAVWLIILALYVAFQWWKIKDKHPLRANIFNTLLIAIAFFLIGGLGFIWNHGVFKNHAPIVDEFYPHDNPIEPGESTNLEVKCHDDERDPVYFRYTAEEGIVPTVDMQSSVVKYTAPKDKTGRFTVVVTVYDNVERPSYPSEPTNILVAWGAPKIRDYNETGLTALKNEDYQSAITNFNMAIDIAEVNAPNFADTHLARGITEAELGMSEEALADFTHYIEIQPDNTIGYLLRASTYQQLGQPDEAYADWLDFYNVTKYTYHPFLSNPYEPYLEEWALRFESASDEERLEILNDAIEISPNPFPYVWEAREYPLPPPGF